MIRALVAIAALTVLALIGVWFADRPGSVVLDWQGWRIETSVGVLLIAVALIAAVAALLYRAWVGLRHAPGAIAEWRRASKRARGYKALSQGMVAVAAGDAEEALRQARRADVLLNEPPLTMLLSAQAAQLGGDEDAARGYFEAMLERPETAFLGLRGLLMQAQRTGDAEQALRLARRAYQLRPKTPWVLTTLFGLLTRAARWRDALPVLDEAVRRGVIQAPDARRLRVAVLLGSAEEYDAGGAPGEALGTARKALRLAPESVPAVLAVVRRQAQAGQRRAATRILQNAWARGPHPAMARLYADLAETDDPLQRLRRLERLAGFAPDHPESHIALAEAALAAKLWGTARRHLERLAAAPAGAAEGAPGAGGAAGAGGAPGEGGAPGAGSAPDAGGAPGAAGSAASAAGPSARVCRLWAELEEAEHGDMEAAHLWLRRAADAPPDPVWLCGDCGAAAAEWTPACPSCGAVATLAWKTPPATRALGPRPAAPLAAPAAADEEEAASEPEPAPAATEHAVDRAGERTS